MNVKEILPTIKRKFMMHRTRNIILGIIFLVFLIVSAILLPRIDLVAQVFKKNPQLDRSKPPASKDEIVAAWQKRQDAIKTFRFAWTEQQTHAKGWLPNPRFPQRELLNAPGLLKDRSYAVSKTLTVDGAKMRYTFELERKEEADGVRVVSPQGENNGLGVGRHYSYVSVFDGQAGKTSLASVTNANPEPAAVIRTMTNVDAQNLDTRPIMMALRPLDAVMGHILINRAVTNQVRTFYKGKSTMLLEEQHDPSGWKMIQRIEPERNFLVCQYLVVFEQKLIADIDIDYTEDPKWGWIPSGWRISQMLDDGSIKLVADAKVTSYTINEPINAEDFQIKTD